MGSILCGAVNLCLGKQVHSFWGHGFNKVVGLVVVVEGVKKFNKIITMN